MKFPKICETEIIPQYELKIDPQNQAFYGKHYYKIKQNSFTKL